MPTMRIDQESHEKLRILTIWYKKKLRLKGKFPLTDVIVKLLEEWEGTHGEITKELVKHPNNAV